MTSFEDIESIIAEWFCDYSTSGNVAVSKLYSLIEKCNDINLKYHLEQEEKSQ